jgi:AraC-like DNA-binding protein
MRVLGDFEFVVILEGQVVYHCDGIQYPAPPGTVVLGRPGFSEFYQWDRHRSTRHSFIHFNFAGGPTEWPDRSQWPIACTTPLPVVPELIHHLIDLPPNTPGTTPPPHVHRAMATLLDAFLLGNTDATRRAESVSPVVERTLLFIRHAIGSAPTRSLTLAELARHANVCDKYLCRAFQKTLSASPMRVVRQLRLQQAMPWLIRSDLKIGEIARRCGFENPYHFSRAFAECFGQPPSDVRRRVLTGEPPPTGNITLP